MKATLRGSGPRPREALREAERRAVAIRKLLKKLGQRQGYRDRGVMDDAVKVVVAIERLARLGQTSPAEDAVEIGFEIEVLTSILEDEVDCILAS